MKKPRLLQITMLSTALGACGGSVNQNLNDLYALQVDAWIDGMPTVIMPGDELPCTELIASYSVLRVSIALPRPSTATSVSLAKDGITVWRQTPSPTESGQDSDGRLYGVARGCLPQDLSENDAVEISVDIESPNLAGRITTKTTLGLAS